MATPYALLPVYGLCLVLAGRQSLAPRIVAVSLWGSSVALATLILYRFEWIGWERGVLNLLWTGVISLSLFWAVIVLRGLSLPPAAPPPPASPGTWHNRSFVAPAQTPRVKVRYRTVKGGK